MKVPSVSHLDSEREELCLDHRRSAFGEMVRGALADGWTRAEVVYAIVGLAVNYERAVLRDCDREADTPMQ